jgi:soluble lytic murein transglycosylase
LAVVALALAATLAGPGIPARAAPSAILSATDESVYRQAFSAADDGKLDYVHGLARKLADKSFEDVLTWVGYQHSGSGASFEQIADFVKAHPTWPHLGILIRRAEEAITVATPADLLRPWFTAHSPESAEGAMAWGRVLQGDGQIDKATLVLRHAWVENSFGPIQEREFLTHFASVLTQEDDNDRLDRLLWDHQDEAATGQMRRVSESARRVARVRMALAHDQSRAEAALAALSETERHDPGLVYELVRYRRERGREDEAIPLLKDPGADLGRPELWWAERAALSRYALQQGRPELAYEIARDHGTLSGIPFAEAEWLAGWIALRFLHDASTAQQHFTRLYDHTVTPLGRARGAYWSARAFEVTGDQAAALHWYQLAADNGTAFYGQLAAPRTGRPIASALPSDPLPTPAEIDDFQHNELTRAARMLGQIGQVAPMRAFLSRLIEIDSSPGIRVQAAALASDFGRADIAITLSHQSEKLGVPLISSGYPVPSLPAADKEKPERALVLGLIRQESGFHRDAVSSAGARGLMQIMPATAIRLARAIKLVFKRKSALDSALTHDSNLNLKLGTVYLVDLLDQFNGSYILAVAAYNAGPARVQKWMHEFGDPRAPGVDAIDWIESIPFSETRNYVQRVLEGVQIYRQRLGATGLTLSLESDLKR